MVKPGTARWGRRRFFLISAAALAVAPRAEASTAFWRGQALGAPASITLGGVGHARASDTFAAVTAEIDRLENIFSLFRRNSELSRLNRQGHLDEPSPDLVRVLSLCTRLHAATGGAFDPSIQPLWLAHALGHEEGSARRMVGWQHVSIAPDRVVLGRPGMALTLNGIAQGFVADQVAGLLGAHGYRDVLVDMGEFAARGTRYGAAWSVAVAGTGDTVSRWLTLSDRALAVSSTDGTILDPANRVGHILDPRRSRHVVPRTVAVTAPSAVIADGLSTGASLLSRAEAQDAVARFAGARLELFD